MDIKIKILICSCLLCLSGCKKYLDMKPDKSQVIPMTLQDCQSLLNHADLIAGSYPVEGEIANTDFYLLPTVYNALQPIFREPYIWKVDAQINSAAWIQPYNKILIANQILEVINKISPTADEVVQWKQVKGSALLLRSTTYLHLTTLFTQPYEAARAGGDLGIPLKLSPSISEEVSRGNLQQTYDRILMDLNESLTLLSDQIPFNPATRSVAMPVKTTAFAVLARVHLMMGHFQEAYEFADASLRQYDVLQDYNIIDTNQTYSFSRFNSEVLYELSGNEVVPVVRGLVSNELYELYQEGDLRKKLFFRNVPNTNTFKFRGSYVPFELFCGYATNQNYLIRAECSARLGNIQAAMDDLHILKLNRWVKNDLSHPYTRPTASNVQEALDLVLLERRKELPFTTLRWVDLRRLNKNPETATTLSRSLNGQDYNLAPNDLRYTFLIPRDIIQRTSFPQNPR